MNDHIGPEPSVPVVKVLSVRGVEYALMSFMLWFGAAAIIWSLLAFVDGDAGYDTMSFPAAVVACALPIFGFLFLRLRRAELANPRLRYEPSKRRFSQITQYLSFFACFFSLVSFVYDIIQKMSESSTALEGTTSVNLGKSALQLLVFLAVAGGIFAYYWVDEHRPLKQQ
jgi:hypothetical protein